MVRGGHRHTHSALLLAVTALAVDVVLVLGAQADLNRIDDTSGTGTALVLAVLPFMACAVPMVLAIRAWRSADPNGYPLALAGLALALSTALALGTGLMALYVWALTGDP
jgi:hypothetical protein